MEVYEYVGIYLGIGMAIQIIAITIQFFTTPKELRKYLSINMGTIIGQVVVWPIALIIFLLALIFG